ncbi:MAG: hypothetical protein KID04_15990 [Clostridium sp.]|nr:hypothetical protein [Clostridium sp.]
MSENKLVYICSPYAGDVGKNIEFAKAACRYAMEQNCTPIAVHLLYTQFLDDHDPVQRKAGLHMGRRVLEACDELWLCGNRISTGMAMELKEAQKLGIPVREISAEQIQGGFAMEKKYGIWAMRSAGSVCGAAQSWCKHDGTPIKFDTMEQAKSYAKQLNESCYSPNVHYTAKEMEPEMNQGSGFSMRM